MKRLLATLLAASALASLSSNVLARPFTDPRSDRVEAIDAANANEPRDPACYATRLVSAGGAFPRNLHTLALRWTGFSNYELVYNGRIILLDAYYDRGSFFPPLGVKAADIKKADVILLGHGHVDHMSDAASIGAQTGAMVVRCAGHDRKADDPADSGPADQDGDGKRRRAPEIRRLHGRTDPRASRGTERASFQDDGTGARFDSAAADSRTESRRGRDPRARHRRPARDHGGHHRLSDHAR